METLVGAVWDVKAGQFFQFEAGFISIRLHSMSCCSTS